MPPKQLTPEQEKDKKLAESLRAPLSFAPQSRTTMSNSTPAIMAQPRPVQPSTPSIFTDIASVGKSIASGYKSVMKTIAPSRQDIISEIEQERQQSLVPEEATKLAREREFQQGMTRVGDDGPLVSFDVSTLKNIAKPLVSKAVKATGQIVKKTSQQLFEDLPAVKQFMKEDAKRAEKEVLKFTHPKFMSQIIASNDEQVKELVDFMKSIDKNPPKTFNNEEYMQRITISPLKSNNTVDISYEYRLGQYGTEPTHKVKDVPVEKLIQFKDSSPNAQLWLKYFKKQNESNQIKLNEDYSYAKELNVEINPSQKSFKNFTDDEPITELYHVTPIWNIPSIKERGLQKRGRGITQNFEGEEPGHYFTSHFSTVKKMQEDLGTSAILRYKPTKLVQVSEKGGPMWDEIEPNSYVYRNRNFKPEELEVLTPRGWEPLKKATGQIIAKEAKPVFEGLKDLSTSIVEKLKGRTTVSKQFISDLTKGAGVKDSEKNIINNVLESSPDNISVADFAKKVQDELLPLKSIQNSTKQWDSGQEVGYQRTVLPPEVRGNIDDYIERVYESPIKTSAGTEHPALPKNKNYFGHTRVEDMADDETRRVIEVQSDLYQKGNLEREKGHWGILEPSESLVTREKRLGEDYVNNEIIQRNKLVDQKLGQYNDPTAHYRMIREEIKKAAEDGKTKLQFPTGETAMKIEGLGEVGGSITPWTIRVKGDWGGIDATQKLLPENMKVGQEVGRMGMPGEADSWIITDVLGDGKFKAVPKNQIDENAVRLLRDEGYTQFELPGNTSQTISNYAQTFDISGKVDQNHAVYKFYDKKVRKFLNKFGGKEIVDDKGVKWIEIPITKEQAKEPVQAFGKAKVGAILGGAGAAAVVVAGNKKKEENQIKLKNQLFTNI